MVLAKVKLKLRRVRRQGQRPPRVNISKLKDPSIKKAFQIQARNRFSVLKEQQNTGLQQFNEVLLETGKRLFGHKKKKREEWISDDTWRKIEMRKGKKSKILGTRSQRLTEQLQTNYKALDKEVKKGARSDKRKYIETIAEEAEQAASKQDMKTLYRLTKTLSWKCQTAAGPVRDQQGSIMSKEVLLRWKEHSEKVLNREDTDTEANIEPAADSLDISIEPPNIEEEKRAIRALKNGKAPGMDQIYADMLKAEDSVTPALLTDIISNVWESEEAPETWKTG
ncbi:uncharacterized protein LOC124273893 [Haliotis rubra]|uniref:uncharacterized protein LOC124273893 n=1 Tax=Haliotis rubra TaxID=36100 RepID=UPI001EE52648|nr:uncharacterized protein LOC124273893 [Haliotis rubra]